MVGRFVQNENVGRRITQNGKFKPHHLAAGKGGNGFYGEIARKLGTKSAQAVGGAVGHNPISIIVPCHRVLGADGSMTGYAGGVDKKIRLLELEGANEEWCRNGR